MIRQAGQRRTTRFADSVNLFVGQVWLAGCALTRRAERAACIYVRAHPDLKLEKLAKNEGKFLVVFKQKITACGLRFQFKKIIIFKEKFLCKIFLKQQ